MRISIFFFSGTGNTWWVAKKIRSIFIEKGHEAEAYSIEIEGLYKEETLAELLKMSDMIGFGFPVYGSSIPRIMKEWINNILCPTKENVKDNERKKAFVFDTMALFSGDTPLLMRKLLKRCGFLVKQAINIRMLSNIPQMPSLMTWEQEKQEELLKKAEKKCEKLVDKILSDKKWVMRRDPISRFLGWIQRVGLKLEGKKILQLYHIDQERCNLCGICVKFCPTNNLSFKGTEDNQKIDFGEDCIYCLRCFNFCPKDAIIMMKRTKDTEKYRRFRGQIPDFNLSKLQE